MAEEEEEKEESYTATSTGQDSTGQYRTGQDREEGKKAGGQAHFCRVVPRCVAVKRRPRIGRLRSGLQHRNAPQRPHPPAMALRRPCDGPAVATDWQRSGVAATLYSR